MIRKVTTFGLLTVLASCGTPEFRAEQEICKATWLSKIPPRLEQEFYNQSYTRLVPTGRTTCTGVGNSVTCNQVMRTEYYTLPAVRTVDRNKAQRDPQIRECTQQKCAEKFGNVECKV